MFLLLGTLLQLLARINLSAYKENLQLFATNDFFKMWNTIMIIYWKNYICRHYILGVVTSMHCF
jgi:hypothetical protein